MQQLLWDCSLEDAAYKEAAACTNPPNVPTMPAQMGQPGQKCGVVYSMMKAKPKSCDPTTIVEQKIKDIWKVGAAKQADQTKVAGNDDFSQMAYSKTNGVGCSYNWCSGNLYLICFYNNDGAAAANLYTAGDTCSSCPLNNNADNCVNSLCVEKQIVYTPPSTICADPALANAALMTDELRIQALDMHNYYRRLLATGWAKDKKITYAKPAVAMPELTYDCTVEDQIMNNLKTCPGSVVAAPNAQANNFKLFKPYDATRGEALSKVIEQWWSPLADTGIADNKYLDSMAGTPMEAYVNMAYDQTIKVGCGVQECAPKGNIQVQCGYVMDNSISEGDDIYKTGKTCSKCAKLTPAKQCSDLGGLCV
ncbi:SCP-like protein [Ancylostoma caninum]|uniref:SCP-like protein n=1 Tax=Ancylostoma caninum TaxID=29170 RepID=A0A368GNG0_ANCCA|nr:SCP-like protein [Ancylostoma caninum]